ncbi:MAG: heme utilization protein, partial [Alphaproteobacteria bacterium]|nr:heme utilization protein [Alphaproteobacteria bacterium]
ETELSSGKIPRFTLNETVAALKFDRTDGGQFNLTLEGPYLDFRSFLSDKKEKKAPYSNPPLRVSIAVDRMRTTDTETVQYSKIYAEIDDKGAFNHLTLEAVAGKGNLRLQYKPDKTGRRVFRLETEDAGAALKAFAVYDNVIGGRMVIYGEPVNGGYDRNLRGTAEITDFKVVKAPALAQLLGAMSLPGMLRVLDDEGLAFTKLEAKFDWKSRPQGGLLMLKYGRTSGNALGLTFNGTYDNAADTVNISGTIIPLSGINNVISSIPLVGDIITGGTGALIAATYSMKGPTQNPNTFVNPLSVLTPGILRRILFE